MQSALLPKRQGFPQKNFDTSTQKPSARSFITPFKISWSTSAILLCSLVLLLSLSAVSAQARQSRIALLGGTVISATGAPPQEHATILMADGVIQYVGRDLDGKDLDSYEVIDISGKWVTPGLIDTNVHLILNIVPEFYIKYEDRLEEIAIQSAQIGLKYGLTTLADTWGPLEPLLLARDRINSGEFMASDVLIAGNIIGTGGPFSPYFMGGWGLRGKSLRYGDWVTPVIQDRINQLWEAGMGPELMALTPKEAADAMRAYIARGVDFVKLGISAHGIAPVEPLMFSDEVLDAMVSEIRKAGLPFQTHTLTIASLRQAIRLQPDLLQHPNVMSPSWLNVSEPQKAAIIELISLIKDMNLLSGLMAVPERSQIEKYQQWTSEMTDDPALNEIMLYRQQGYAGTTYEQLSEGIRVWLDAAIPFTIATDQGPEAADLGPTVWGRLGRAHFDRMIGLQDAGASPMDILIAATRNGAAAYHLEDRKGTIEVGKMADLLIVDANPLDDIGNLRKISSVFKHGVNVDRKRLPTVKVLDYDPEIPWPY